MSEMGKPWEARGVSRSSWYRYLLMRPGNLLKRELEQKRLATIDAAIAEKEGVKK